MSTKKTKSKKPVTNAAEPAINTEPRPGLFVVIKMTLRDGDMIPREGSPTRLHRTDEAAVVEAGRLAAIMPGQQFAVFACLGIVETKIPAPLFRNLNDSDIAGPGPAF